MYVPVPTHVPHHSPQVRELGHKIEHVIREYQQSHPHMSPLEVQQALKMAEANTGAVGRSARTIAAVVALLTGVLVLGGILFWQRAQGAPDGSGPVIILPLIGIAAVGVAAVALAMRRRH
jgi:hypothetical protein